jgi:DNA-binding HxlR family transcriptional regulator
MRVSKVEYALTSAGEKIVRVVDQLPMEADDLATVVARGGPPFASL